MKWYVVKKLLLVAGFIIAAILLNIISGYLAVPASQASVDASFDVMAGNSTTVLGIATHDAINGLLAVTRIALMVVAWLLFFSLVADIALDIKNNSRKAEEGSE